VQTRFSELVGLYRMGARSRGPMNARAALLALVLIPSVSAGQSATAASQDPRPPSAATPSLESLVRTIESQQKLIDAQGRQLDELRREIAEVRALTRGQKGEGQASPVQRPAPSAAGSQPVVEQTPSRVPERPHDVVSAGDFPGSFKVPGSDAALKIGGLVRVNWVSTYDALLVEDRFATSAIPIAGSADAARGGRVGVIASPSRFNFDLRTPTGVGYMRAFIEGDFAGDNNTLRLRHAYGQWRRLIFGQTWSTFSDPEAEPDGIDFEGLNAIVLFRQPQIRWSVPLSERLRLALALEDPNPDLTDATGVNQVPDFIARVRWEPRLGGHVQLSGILRQLRGEPTDQANEITAAGGYGVNVSGRLPFPFWHKRDHLLFQHNSGRGIGRYISDLRTLGGQDGVFDPVARELRALDAFSGYVGYEHWWSERLRSSISFGIVTVANLDIQPGDALHLTRRSTINFMWSPIPRLDLVTEFLWGRRVNKDRQDGFAAQTQIGSTFRF
jgi:DcaP outer membrane protein